MLGAGAFGTALAISICGNGPVTLWMRDEVACAAMTQSRTNARYLPTVTFPDNLTVTSNLELASQVDRLLLAVPMQKLRGFLERFRSDLNGKTLVACCKGVELATGLGPIDVIEHCIPQAKTALLTGPSFAADIAKGLPTALTLACVDTDLGKSLQHELTTANLRLYRTTDTTGASLGGALKNIFAIACGAVVGAGLGDSARAALMTRGFAEMQRYALAQGARAETLAGLSGFGDLTLTCSSSLSRNYQLGHAIGQQRPVRSIDHR